MTNGPKLVTTLSALLAGLLGGAAEGGMLDPALERAVAGMHPGETVDVIVRCSDTQDVASVAKSVGKKGFVRALRQKGMACERAMRKVLAGTAEEAPANLWIINGIAARVPVAALRGLANRAGVATVYLNEKVELPPDAVEAGVPGNPPLSYWNISETRVTDLWALGHYGTGAVVATMDTGVDLLHADIGPKWRGGANSWYDPNGEHDAPFDASGHGTGVMGLIVGGNAGGFDVGMAPDAQWVAVKIFNDAGQSNLERIHQGFQWLLDPDGDPATDDAPHVVNSSWVLQGTEGVCLGEFADDIAALKAAGIAVVFAAGNSGQWSDTSMEPANDPGSLSVGALDASGRVVSTSSRGPSACDGGFYPRLAAPGKDVLSTGLTSGGANPVAYAFGTGTSYAAPHVAGAIAVLKGAFPDWPMGEIEAAVLQGAFDLSDPGPDNDTGAGLLDVVEPFFALDGATPPTPPPPPPGPKDQDQDGVPDDADLCAGTPAGATVDANGCAASQRDSDLDGISDALDLCPGTPAGTAVDATGCGPVDADADGHAADLDCNDGDPSIHPGASEVRSDGVDQDCNGYDLTIDITAAVYRASRDRLDVTATSALGAKARLQVVGYGAMSWDRRTARWTFSARNVGGKPATVTVSGAEGQWSRDVQ